MRVYLHNHGAADGSPYFPALRQTFFSNGIVGELTFSEIPSPSDEWIILFGGSNIPRSHTYIDRSKRILVLMEHPAIWQPPDSLLEAVGIIICPFAIKHPPNVNLIISHAAVPWFYGLQFRTDQGLSHVPILDKYLELQDLDALHPPQKPKLISCVVSAKRLSPGHAWRMDLAQALKKYFGNEIDLWGFGWNPILDKREAIDPYKFSIAIENDLSDHYWTEKLSDAILGYSIPIYSGASKVQNDFSGEIPQIRYATDIDFAINSIKKIIDKEYNNTDLIDNRKQILFKHNLFYLLESLIREK